MRLKSNNNVISLYKFIEMSEINKKWLTFHIVSWNVKYFVPAGLNYHINLFPCEDYPDIIVFCLQNAVQNKIWKKNDHNDIILKIWNDIILNFLKKG